MTQRSFLSSTVTTCSVSVLNTLRRGASGCQGCISWVVGSGVREHELWEGWVSVMTGRG